MRRISIIKCGQCVLKPGIFRGFWDFDTREPVMDICKKCLRKWQPLLGETHDRFKLNNGCYPVKRKVKYEINDCIEWSYEVDQRLEKLETKRGKK